MKDFAKSIRTGNSSFQKEIWTVENEDGSGSDFQSESIAYATARKWARETGEPQNIFKTELDENGRPKGQPKFIKTVNNSKVGNKAIVLKDGDVWVVLYANETKSKEFDSEAEARKFAASVGNSRVGNARWSILEVYNVNDPNDGRNVGTVEANTSYEAIKKFKEEKPEYNGKNLIAVKVGNESIDKQEWSMFKGLAKDAEKEVGNETYQHKQYPDKYVIIDGKNYKIITDGKVEKSGELTDAILYGINQTYKRVPNSIKSRYQGKSVNKKLGNETAEEKKYGKVMEEFFDGKLKSSSGETVTNPEQAKAIAYSESEKVDNLKRARNSIKKG